MLKFYRNNTNQFTNWVDKKLEEMVVAHKLIDVREDRSLPNGYPGKICLHSAMAKITGLQNLKSGNF